MKFCVCYAVNKQAQPVCDGRSRSVSVGLSPAVGDSAERCAGGNRNWLRFKELELEFADNYGVETWADVFNFRVMPALEPEAKRWLLIQKCSQGIKSVKILK